MSNISFDQLSDCVWLRIMSHCRAQDLAALSSTSSRLHQLANDKYLWKHFLRRDFNIVQPDLGTVESVKKLYTNLFYKYGCVLGMYETQINPCGAFLEIRYKAGNIEGVHWEPSSRLDVTAPLKESVLFTISGDHFPPHCTCLPHIHPHACSFNIDKRKGVVIQNCSAPSEHMEALGDQFDDDMDLIEQQRRMTMYLGSTIGKGLVHLPLTLPTLEDVPSPLKLDDGTLPKHIISPGLFQGSYSSHGLEVILFRYKDENEIHGYKVTGDENVFAGKITVKINLKFPLLPTKEDQKSFNALLNYEPTMIKEAAFLTSEQAFLPPEDCFIDAEIPLPVTCKARYHGFGQIAYSMFTKPRFTPVHVAVFNDDLVGVIWLELRSMSFYSRIKQKFTPNFHDGYKNVV
ncbi:F-box only protein 31-like [Homarus americanus]|uniref:F-box only protein 31-like n=1 Tax=Homarus americanus TaxID=6706 RepID=UPI001C46D39E|nr:F-box only protein 31-like [Homarus americanus]XP_042225218.1 F-box only protein 31-like [Homarus americanus]